MSVETTEVEGIEPSAVHAPRPVLSQDEIRAAVEWGSFDNLQKLETSGTFSQGGMKLVDANDPNTYKVRRGKVGGYRDYFSDEEAAKIDALVRENLAPVYGYGGAA